MRRIRVWKISGTGAESRALPIEELSDTETERRLEDLLVASPDLLMPGLVLVARQLATAGGPLDLVGLDGSGRLVVFELKRGTLTRDAVAQVLDYSSDLAGMDPEALGRLLEENSGRDGIERIEDFAEWYGQEYPHADHVLAAPPRMILVGLGADGRATRIVNFLATSGIDIQLLTFHAFRSEGDVLLARQAETVAPADSRATTTTGTKEGNLRILLESARQADARELLLDLADFIQSQLPCYRWPNKTVFSFSLQERTEEGQPTARNYFSLGVQQTKPRCAVLTISPRAAEVAPDSVESFLAAMPHNRYADSTWRTADVWFDSSSWPERKELLTDLLQGVVAGWRAKLTFQSAAEATSAGLA